jgi:chromate transporter
MSPALCLMLVFSVAYLQWGHVPAVGKLFQGAVPAVAAIIVASAWRLRAEAVAAWRERSIALCAALLLLSCSGMYASVLVVVGAALLGSVWLRQGAAPLPAAVAPLEKLEESDLERSARWPMSRLEQALVLSLGAGGMLLLMVDVLLRLGESSLLKIFGVFAGMSLLLFGGANVFIPLMQQSLVEGYHWLSPREFVDALAMAQMLPGPVVVSAAFVGFKVAGVAGAVIAMLGISMPSALLMLLCMRVLDRIKSSVSVVAALRGVRAAVFGNLLPYR